MALFETESESRIDELRSMIDEMLSETKTYARIRQVISETAEAGAPGTRATLARLVSAVETSPVPELLAGIDGTGVGLSTDEDALALRVEVRGGAAFVGELVDASSKGGAQAVRAHFLFNRQRGASSLVAAGVEPKLRGSFLFEIARPRPRSETDWHRALTLAMPRLRVAVTRERCGRGVATARRELVATGSVDWRRALLEAGRETTVPLAAAGPDSVVVETSAALRVVLDVVALGDSQVVEPPFDETTVRREIQRSLTLRGEASRRFYLYAKDWWREYGRALPSADEADERGVQLFARDEAGELRCVCAFVYPLRAGRGLDSPRHAARFVSLVALEKEGTVGGGARADVWHSPHGILARRAGDVWDHATLLCSLLLGFGLDAYVALGTMRCDERAQQHHAWVVTFSTTDDAPRVVAWESATGRRASLVPLDPEAARRYATLACVFNHSRLLANRQRSDKLVDGVSLDLDDPTSWMLLDAKAHGGVEDEAYVSPAADFALVPTRLDVPAAELALENELRELVERRRLAQLGLLTTWDRELSYMLQPALAAYENDRVTGHPFGNHEFQDAIKRHVPEGHCFKGFPCCFTHLQPARMLAALERGDLSSDVINTTGDHVRHALRARIFPYAEDVCACWIMIATFYLKPGASAAFGPPPPA
ncbi:hypothetical protein CTAYLR_004204 [Chrysophaeum taylorii]|uniref:Centrosomal protein of 76 kDa n=1 Tax=Chrysophaeum taylorii TaxID=2483200 RepID=A0AAD7UD61_9STRA|nr:hypothetical protein CTAYLR_004204 [Chrysophaeum taylorii]